MTRKNRKFKLHVLYGEEACELIDGNKLSTIKKKIRGGIVDGSYATYAFDTNKDRSIAMKILNDFDGWGNVYYETPEENQTQQ